MSKLRWSMCVHMLTLLATVGLWNIKFQDMSVLNVWHDYSAQDNLTMEQLWRETVFCSYFLESEHPFTSPQSFLMLLNIFQKCA